MRVELKSLKVNNRMSEETLCFSATLFLNGVKRGVVMNRGHGGPDEYTDWSAAQELEAYAKTLPPNEPSELFPEGFPQSAESLVNDLVAAEQTAADLRKILKARVLYLSTDGKLYQTTKIPAHDLARNVAGYAAKYPQYRVLNSLPFDEALALYRTHG